MKFWSAILTALVALSPLPALAAEPSDRVQTGPTPFDQAAREQQVASGNLRIPPLDPAQFSPEIRQLKKQTMAFFRVKGRKMPGSNQATYRHPTLFYNQSKLGLDLNRHGTLPPRQRELVILRTAWLVRSPFEWGEHVAYGKRLGLTAEEIERITQGSSAPGWSEHDKAVLRGVEELLGDHAVSDATWAVLAKTWTEQQLIELPGLVGSYTLTAMLFNSLRVGMLPDNLGFAAR